MKLINLLNEWSRKVEGSAYIAYHLIGQAWIPYLPPEQLNTIRDRRVCSIVRYAAETVPYYQDLFRRERIDVRDIKTAADLARLPLIEKQLLREQPEYFRSQSRLGQTAIPLKTSGSTGVPLTIYHDRYDFLNNAAARQRGEIALREALGGLRNFKTVSIGFSESMIVKVRSIVSQSAFVPGKKGNVPLSFLDPLDQVLTQLNQLRPDVLQSYGSYLELLYGSVAARKIPLHRPRLIMYNSDSLSEKARELIRANYGIPILSIYGTVETLNIGFSCIAQQGIHVNDDRTHVRIINAEGREAGREEPGEVIVSNLVNRGTVLLNYRLGDLAALTTDRCECGRTLPRLLDLEGRVEDILQLPSGRFVHPRAVWRILRPRNDVVQYQLIQTAPGSFELHLAMTDQSKFAKSAAEIIPLIIEALGEPVSIQPIYVNAVEPYGIKKRRPVVGLPRQL